jgi:hypothetical protein
MSRKRIEFTPVNRIAEPCACCAHERKRGRGVRVDVDGGDAHGMPGRAPGITFYYCDGCIKQLEAARKHP